MTDPDAIVRSIFYSLPSPGFDREHGNTPLSAPQIRALDPFGRMGPVYRGRCSNPKCSSRRVHKTKRTADGPIEVCAHCDHPWPWDLGFDPKSKGGRTGAAEDALIRALDRHTVGNTEHRLQVAWTLYHSRTHRWPIRLYFAYVLGETVREILRKGPQRWPQGQVSWSERSVYRLIQDGRQRFSAELARNGG